MENLTFEDKLLKTQYAGNIDKLTPIERKIVLQKLKYRRRLVGDPPMGLVTMYESIVDGDPNEDWLNWNAVLDETSKECDLHTDFNLSSDVRKIIDIFKNAHMHQFILEFEKTMCDSNSSADQKNNFVKELKKTYIGNNLNLYKLLDNLVTTNGENEIYKKFITRVLNMNSISKVYIPR